MLNIILMYQYNNEVFTYVLYIYVLYYFYHIKGGDIFFHWIFANI